MIGKRGIITTLGFSKWKDRKIDPIFFYIYHEKTFCQPQLSNPYNDRDWILNKSHYIIICRMGSREFWTYRYGIRFLRIIILNIVSRLKIAFLKGGLACTIKLVSLYPRLEHTLIFFSAVILSAPIHNCGNILAVISPPMRTLVLNGFDL